MHTDFSKFLVIDTEGKPCLTEIAIVDEVGTVVYVAAVVRRKSLVMIIEDICDLISTNTLIFHYADHDRRILQNSFRQLGIEWQPHRVICTWEMAKQVLPKLPSYSLEYLCKHFNLKVDRQRFNNLFAHRARYDALFTYQLYRQLKHMQIANPFSSNRVDNPFQQHVDFANIYSQEFTLLSAILQDIREEPNRQSRGAVVIGEPGTGKTHLMMRLAKQHLKTNRLLFISQPNNAETVFYHTYCRVLESLAEKVFDTPYTQLEYLLANAFVRILQSMERVTKSVRGQSILTELEKNPLDLYNRIAKEGKKHLEAWDYIEKNILTWWGQEYSAAGFGLTIVQGIVRFCRYRDPKKREIVRRWLAAQVLTPEEVTAVGLSNWEEEVSRESFALEALKVLGRLSTLDEPLIFVFDQLEGLWLRHHSSLLQSFGHTIKEIITQVPNSLLLLNLFPDRWQEFRYSFDGSVVERINYEVRLKHPDKEQLWDILQLRAGTVGLNLEAFFQAPEVDDILEQATIRAVLRRASQHFQAKTQNIPLPAVEVPSLIATVPREIVPKDLEQRLVKLESSSIDANLVATNFVEERLQNLERSVGELHNYLDRQKSYQSMLSTDRETTATDNWETLFETSQSFSDQQSTHSLSANPEENAIEILIENRFKLLEKRLHKLENFTPSGKDKSLPLNLTDEVTLYLQERQKQIEADYNKPTIVTDSDDLGKLTTIVEAFLPLYKLTIDTLHLGKRKIPDHLLIRTPQNTYAIGFLHVSGNMFAPRIKNLNELVISAPHTHFYLCRDEREPAITGKVGLEEIEKLNYATNGNFIIMNKTDRVTFELIYQLIIDIHNRDLEIPTPQAIISLISYIPAYWLVKILTGEKHVA